MATSRQSSAYSANYYYHYDYLLTATSRQSSAYSANYYYHYD